MTSGAPVPILPAHFLYSFYRYFQWGAGGLRASRLSCYTVVFSQRLMFVLFFHHSH